MSFYPFEQELQTEGYTAIAGIDEAGRGPLAGPVVAAAVMLRNEIPEGLNDSKKLSAKRREALYSALQESDALFGTGIVDQFQIDKINVLQATVLAMKKAIGQLRQQPDFLLIDGKYLPKFVFPAKTIIGGDSKCASIAAASIIAKVERDRLMVDLEKYFPGYGFAQHKGYGTKQHREAIETLGPTPLHRLTFGGVKEHLPKFRKEKRALGKWGEDYTCYRLWQKGVRVVARNFHASRDAELDIVALSNERLHFIEVKTGSSKDFSAPEEWVDSAKQSRIFEAAEHFLYDHNEFQDIPSQFDIAAVEFQKGETRVRYYENAFSD